MMGSEDKKTLARKRVIETLEDNEVLVGADVAAKLGLKDADKLDVLGKQFTVTAVLPQTGTVDDSRIFAHLHVVQDCRERAGHQRHRSDRLLPADFQGPGGEDQQPAARRQGGHHHADRADAAERQPHDVATCRCMFLVIIIFVGGASIANYMYANVFERRREIGTLMALGATSGLVLRIFLLKALMLGLAGGIGGYVLGTILAVVLGPKLAGVVVLPMPMLALLAVGISAGWRWWPVTSPPGVPPGLTLVSVSRRSDPC